MVFECVFIGVKFSSLSGCIGASSLAFLIFILAMASATQTKRISVGTRGFDRASLAVNMEGTHTAL